MAGENTQLPPRPTALDRVLNLFTEVRAGESATALLLLANIFLLLSAYYVIKPVRDSLMAAMEGGDEYKSYLSAVIALSLLVAVPAYAAFAKRLQRNRLVIGATLFFVSNLVLFAFAAASEGASTFSVALPGFLAAIMPTDDLMLLPVVFFVWVGIFNMMVVAQFWAFSNDIYNEEQGKRLFVLIGIGASVGAVLGAGVVRAWAKQLETYQLFAIAAVVLTLCCVLTQVVHVRESGGDREPEPAEPDAAPAKAPPSDDDGGAFAMVFKHRYLTLLAVFSVTFTLVNTNGEYLITRLVGEWITTSVAEHGAFDSDHAMAEYKRQLGSSFYGGFYFWVNLCGAVLQMFVLSRLVKFAGLARTFYILPVIALFGATALVIFPMLSVLRVGKIAENSVDYSINNTVRNMLWLPTTTAMKYQAKQAVDTFFVRMGDVGSALMVFVLAGQLQLGVRAFAGVNLLVVAFWLFLLAPAIMRGFEDMKAAHGTAEAAKG